MMSQTTRNSTLMIMALFMLQPMAFGSWLAMIPFIKSSLELSKANLALALLGLPVSLIPTLPLASRVVAKIGPRKTSERIRLREIQSRQSHWH